MKTEHPEKVLVFSPEEIGGAVLSLPGLQLFRQDYPDVELTVIANPLLEDLWRMSPVIDFYQSLNLCRNRILNIEKLKREQYDRVYFLRDDFRPALVAWRAGIARRIGFSGHRRRLLLTEIVHRPDVHRQFEFMNVFGVQGEPPAPELVVPHTAFQTLERKLTHFPELEKNRSVIFQILDAERPLGARPVIILMPGGAGERWPATHFGLLAKSMISSLKAILLVFGDLEEQDLCAQVAMAAGPEAINVAGRITLEERAALLALSDCVVCNAGDWMHLASALGAPVVPVCGLIDPAKNSPLGEYSRLDDQTASSAEPEFEEVARTLTAVTTDLAYRAVVKQLSR